jgi:flagellar biogenesis protein FliO
MLETLRILVSLGLVLLLAYWSLRVLLPRLQMSRGGLGGSMRILDRLPLGMRSYLCVVKVGEQIFLISVSPGTVQYLAELPSDGIGKMGADPPAPPNFSEILQSSRGAAENAWGHVLERASLFKEKKRGSSHEEKDHNDG